MTSTDIINSNTLLLNDGLQSSNVSTSKVHNMDIVAYTSTIVCVIIITEHTKLGAFTNSSLSDIRHQIVRYAIGILTNSTALVSTYRIEIAKQYNIPLIVCLLNIHEHLFKHRLGLSIRIGAVTLGALLGNGNDGRITINSSTRRENHILTAILTHNITEHECTIHVVLVVLKRLGTTFTHRLKTSKVDTSIKLVLIKHFLQTLTVTDVDLVEGNLLTDNLSYALQ